LLLALVATAVILPNFFLGNTSGQDYDFHIASWMDVAHQWHEGGRDRNAAHPGDEGHGSRDRILYPRWAEWANWGFGEPRFIFYPPASWMAGAVLGSVLPWRAVPGALIWLCIVASGMSMWKLAREWLPAPRARAAAMLYAVNPYNIIVVYYRSDFAELMAAALLPILIWAALRVVRGERRYIALLAGLFTGSWLSNAPAAVIATYSLGVLLVVGCALQRRIRPLVDGVAAMVAGFGLAAFYIVPAAWEQRWVQIQQTVTDDLLPSHNFLFTNANDPEFIFFNWKVSAVAIATMLITGIAAVFVARRRREMGALWWTLVALGTVAVLLMFRPSAVLWRIVPKLQFVQFPWRWMEVLGVVFAMFVAAAFSDSAKWRSWLLIAITAAIVAAGAVAIIRDTWWDEDDIPAMADAINNGHGYEGTDEYAPVDTDRLSLPGNPDDSTRPRNVSEDTAPLFQEAGVQGVAAGVVAGAGAGSAGTGAAIGKLAPANDVKTQIEEWTAERRLLRVDESMPVVLAPRLVNFPSWKVTVDGGVVHVGEVPETGQMLIPLPAGEHEVEIYFQRTWDRAVGGWISAVSAMALAGFALVGRRRKFAG
jgi:6-pyruvoyl-tetrahydropterin synthase related domain